MLSPADIAALIQNLSNRLDLESIGGQAFAGVIGDAPSHYSKSPRLWNSAFQRLEISARYLPFDVDDAHLGDLLAALRRCANFLGVNVTVPHKVRVMDFLDSVDPGAARIQAVNTIVRQSDGKLAGYNTDGEGFIDSLQTPQDDGEAFLSSLAGMDVLLLGAGGSARAVGFHVADRLKGGTLFICNRTLAHARSLAGEITRSGGNAAALTEEEMPSRAPQVGLIVNCTTKGQGGLRKSPDGTATLLESYSALAPASPPAFAASEFELADFERRWREQAGADVRKNQQESERLSAAIPARTRFYDLIYHPEETVFLRHGRTTGHRTMNGRAMIVHQAAIAFHQHICAAMLRERGLDTPAIAAQIVQTMHDAW